MSSRSFLFDWEVLETDTLVTPEGGTVNTTLSRVYLDDSKLKKKSAASSRRSAPTPTAAMMNGSARDPDDSFVTAPADSTPSRFHQSTPADTSTPSRFDKSVPSGAYPHFDESAISKLNISPSISSGFTSFETSGFSGMLNGGGDEKRVVSLDYDFSYQPERDAHLLAMNANETFKGDKVIMKYYRRRHALFTRIDQGVLMDREGWFSVSPERVAEHIADRLVEHDGCVILDAFAGVGGNAIQFALRGAFVIAIEWDPVKLRCAAENARIYGVRNRIEFICGDFFHIAGSLAPSRQKKAEGGDGGEMGGSVVDSVFLSPPWGGPAYKQTLNFGVERDFNPGASKILEAARKFSHNICFYVPKSCSSNQLFLLAGPSDCAEVEQTMLNGRIAMKIAYYGDLVGSL